MLLRNTIPKLVKQIHLQKGYNYQWFLFSQNKFLTSYCDYKDVLHDSEIYIRRNQDFHFVPLHDITKYQFYPSEHNNIKRELQEYLNE